MVGMEMAGNIMVKVFWFQLLLGVAAFAYTPPTGIPDPDWGTTHPIDAVAPTLPASWTSDVAGFYFLEQGGTNTNEGYPGDPRGTVPTLAAGDVLVINGAYDGAATITAIGTDAQPCWVVDYDGDGIFGGGKLTLHPTTEFLIWDGVDFDFTTAGKIEIQDGNNNLCFRNFTATGRGSVSGTSSASADNQAFFVIFNPTAYGGIEHIVIHNNVLTLAGMWQYTSGDPDAHCISMGVRAQDMWILENEFSYTSGNAVQVGAGTTGSTQDTDVCRRVYIGGNTAHHIAQSAFWAKRSDVVIMSENTCHTMRRDTPSNPNSGGFGAQYGPRNLWIIGNTVHNCQTGVQINSNSLSAGATTNDVRIIGNTFYDIRDVAGNSSNNWRSDAYQSGGAAINVWGAADAWIVGNTMDDVDCGILSPTTAKPVHVVNNIITNRNATNGVDIHIDGDNGGLNELNNNIFPDTPYLLYGNSTPVITIAGVNAVNASAANNTDTAPTYVNAGSRDYNLQAGSAGIDEGLTHAVYATYQSAYSLDITRSAPQGAAWDIGAFEYSTTSAWSYVGIPYVTANVPSEIMPAIPDGADIAAFPYDPCTIATPVFSDGASQYYIDSVNGNDGTAGNSGRGSVANPRQTLPNIVTTVDAVWTLSAGDQIFLTDNSKFGDPAINLILNVSGTASDPVWITSVGGGMATFIGDRFWCDGEHLILDTIKWRRDVLGKIRFSWGDEGTGLTFAYGTMRNSMIDGRGSDDVANAAVSGENAEFVCLYNNEMFGFGTWDRQSADNFPKHAIQMTNGAHWWWIIDNEIYHCEGQSIQVNTSNHNNAEYAERPHYVYIAGNEFYENNEPGVACKNNYHTIISSNYFHDFRNEFRAANGTGILPSIDNEGLLSGFEWAIFNTIVNCGVGIRVAGTSAQTINDPLSTNPVQTSGQASYVVGNLMTDCDIGVLMDGRGHNVNLALANGTIDRTWMGEQNIINNTIISNDQGIQMDRANGASGESYTSTVSGNIIYNEADGVAVGKDIDLFLTGDGANVVRSNIVYNAVTAADIDTNHISTNEDNVLDSDPLFTAFGSDYSLTESSPAVDAGTLSPVYALFSSMYGIDITPDLNGDARPNGAAWDAGAYEYSAQTPATTRNRNTAGRTVLSGF